MTLEWDGLDDDEFGDDELDREFDDEFDDDGGLDEPGGETDARQREEMPEWLKEAVKTDNLRAVMDYAEKGGSLEVFNGEYHESILHTAAYAGAFRVVRWLVEEKKFPVDTMDDLRYTPLHDAARGGRTAVALYLLMAGADGAHVNGHDRDAYQQALKGDHPDTAEAIITRGAAQWDRISDDEIMHRHKKHLAGYTMTEIFNMRARTYMLLTLNHATKTETTVMKTFGELDGTTLVDDAEAEFKKRGGKDFSAKLDKKRGLSLD